MSTMNQGQFHYFFPFETLFNYPPCVKFSSFSKPLIMIYCWTTN